MAGSSDIPCGRGCLLGNLSVLGFGVGLLFHKYHGYLGINCLHSDNGRCRVCGVNNLHYQISSDSANAGNLAENTACSVRNRLLRRIASCNSSITLLGSRIIFNLPRHCHLPPILGLLLVNRGDGMGDYDPFGHHIRWSSHFRLRSILAQRSKESVAEHSVAQLGRDNVDQHREAIQGENRDQLVLGHEIIIKCIDEPRHQIGHIKENHRQQESQVRSNVVCERGP